MSKSWISEVIKDRIVQVTAIVVSAAGAGLLFIIIDHGGQQKLEAYLENIQGNQIAHFAAAEKHEEDQDGRINVIDDRSKQNEFDIRLIGPVARSEGVDRAIRMVESAIECERASCDESCWVNVPGASGDYLTEDMRVRVEEHFRRSGYEVCRERELATGRWRGFWIFVDQS